MSGSRLFWKDWCRLCAKIKTGEDQLEHDFEPLAELSDFVDRICGKVSSVAADFPDKLCATCVKIVQEFADFAGRCEMVSNMYADLLQLPCDETMTDDQADALRKKYGLDLVVTLDIQALKEEPVEEQFELMEVENIDDLESHSDKLHVELDPDYFPKHSIKEETSNSFDADEKESVQEFEIRSYADDPKEKSSTLKREKRKQEFADIQGALKCADCGESFNLVREYKQHMRDVHDVLVSPFNCDECSKRFPTLKQYQKHDCGNDGETQPSVKKTVIKRAPLGRPRKSNTDSPGEEQRFICEECGKSCTTKGALKDHKIVHTEERPFQCSHCPKRFKNMPSLKTHEDIHNKTNYICPHCGIILNTRITLKMHLVVHSDEKRFKCQYCGNEYKRAKALKSHLILHTGLRPYSCPFCDKTFANGSNCRSHKKKAHPVQLAALEAAGGVAPRTTNIPNLQNLRTSTSDLVALSIDTIIDSADNENERGGCMASN